MIKSVILAAITIVRYCAQSVVHSVQNKIKTVYYAYKKEQELHPTCCSTYGGCEQGKYCPIRTGKTTPGQLSRHKRALDAKPGCFRKEPT